MSTNDLTQSVRLDTVKKGDYIKRKADATTIYRKGHYDRSAKRYYLSDVYDMNREIALKGSTMVFIGFTY